MPDLRKDCGETKQEETRMRHVFVRLAREADREKFARWSVSTKKNLCDSAVLGYANTLVYCAYDSKGPIVYVPVQKPAMMEALAINPAADPVDVAVALKELTQAIVTQCHMDGTGEILFLCEEETTQKFAEHQLFERVPWNLYRIKLADLEAPCASTPE